MSACNDEVLGGGSEEDIWHLRQPEPVPRNRSSSGHQVMHNGVTRQVRSSSDMAQTDVSSGPINNQVEGPSATVFDENVASHARSGIFANLKNTLSSVFQTSSTKVHTDDLACNVILLDGRSVLFTLSAKNAIGRDLLIRVTTYQGLEQTDLFGLTYSIDGSHPSKRLLPPESDQGTGSVLEADLPGITTTASPIPNGCTGSTTWPLVYNVQQQASNNQLPTSTTSKQLRTGTRSRTISYSAWIGDLWSNSHAYVGDVSFWLAMDKRICEQCRGPPYVFQFQVKYYIPHPDRDIFCDETRRQYCLQLRQHLLTGRLPCSFNTHILLGAYISQFVLGDAHPQHSELDDSTSRSLRSSFSSKRCSRRFSSSVSEARSILSERACSLAEPELSDMDNENCDPSDEQSIAWFQPQSADDRSPRTERKSATLGQLGRTRLSVDCSRTCHSDSAHTTYLSVLPHLNRLSRASSFRSAGVRTTMDDGRPQPDDCPSLDLTDLDFEQPGANWPYTDPSGYFCPEMLRRIVRLHRRIRGMPRARAERRFLHEAKKLSMYGVELHLVRRVKVEQRSPSVFHQINGLYRSFNGLRRSLVWPNAGDREAIASDSSVQIGNRLGGSQTNVRFQSHVQDVLPFAFNSYPEFAFSAGVCSTGLMLYWGQLRVARFPWPRIVAISLRKQAFILTVRKTNADSRRRILCFTLTFASRKLATHFYSSCVDHHKYFRLGLGRSGVLPDVSVSSPVVSIPNLTGAPVSPQESSTRPIDRQQNARIRHWLRCFIPQLSDSSPSVVRRRTRRVENPRDRSPVACLPPDPEHPAPDPDSPAALEPSDQLPLDAITEPWLRRDCAHHPMDSRQTNDSSAPPERLHTVPVCVEAVKREPVRIPWQSRPEESPVVSTVRRVRSAVSGMRRDSGRQATASATRPVSFSAMHKRAVSGRPLPPPRPKVPPTPLDSQQYMLSTTASSMTDSVDRAVLRNLNSIPVVPTFTAVFTPDGHLIRTPRLDLAVPIDEPQQGTVLSNLGEADELTRLSAAPPQTSTPVHTKRFAVTSSIPVVPTRSIRVVFSPYQMNTYQILDSMPIQCVSGLCAPLVPTKSVFLRFAS